MTYDHIGEQLAVNFDASNQLGFASALSYTGKYLQHIDQARPGFHWWHS